VNILAVSKDRKGQSTGDELLTDDNDSLRRAIHNIAKMEKSYAGKIDGEKKGENKSMGEIKSH
jgi:hypothetical protein